HQVEPLIPAGLAPLVRRGGRGAAARRLGRTPNKRCRQARGGVYVVRAEAALHPPPPVVRRGVARGIDSHDPVILDLPIDLAAYPAVGARAADHPVGLHIALQYNREPRTEN